MKKIHNLLFLIALLTLSWQVYELLSSDSEKIIIKQDVVSKTNKIYSSDLNGGENQDINTLRQELARLDRRMSSFEAQVQQQVNKPAEAEQEDLALTVDFSEEDRIEQEKEEITFKENIDQLEVSFLNEKQDKLWTEATTDALYQSLESSELIGTSLIDLECRSTLCRIEVDHKNFNDQENFDLNFGVNMPSVFSKFTVSRTEDENGGGSSSTVLYAFRDQQ